MRHHRAAAAAILLVLLAALLPAVASAHSELVTSIPGDGAVLASPPPEISGEFSEALDATRSVLELRAPGGGVLATGRVPAEGPATHMAIVDLPSLAPGTYEVRWTSVTADDNGIERGTFSFTLLAPSPGSPGSPAPSAAASSAPPSAPASGSSSGDLLVPLAVLAGVLVAGGAWLLRRRR